MPETWQGEENLSQIFLCGGGATHAGQLLCVLSLTKKWLRKSNAVYRHRHAADRCYDLSLSRQGERHNQTVGSWLGRSHVGEPARDALPLTFY
jgi:hypothetical protein